MTTCRVTPDCRAPAIARVSVVGEAIVVRHITSHPIGYPSCADHMHHVIDVRLHNAMPAPAPEDLQR